MVRHPAGSGLASGFRASTSASGTGIAIGADETRTVRELRTKTKREMQRIVCVGSFFERVIVCVVWRVKTDKGGTVVSKDTRGDVFYIRTPTLVKGNTISRLREGLVHLG